MIENDNCGSVDESSIGIPADPLLTAQGWVRRHLADRARAEESVQLYEEMGFEVLAEQLTPGKLGTGCGDCTSMLCDNYIMIYTRKLKDA